MFVTDEDRGSRLRFLERPDRAFGWPLVAAGALKILYDLLLLTSFRHVRPPEEASRSRR
ncbi:MAG: hypothetical protein IT519_12450 [Burkholderiales bacterium]|nr:hypothetical protein [Burkholderiales bacterium]